MRRRAVQAGAAVGAAGPAEPDDATRLALVHHTVWRATYADLVPDSFWQTATLEERTSSWKRWLGPEASSGRIRITVA